MVYGGTVLNNTVGSAKHFYTSIHHCDTCTHSTIMSGTSRTHGSAAGTATGVPDITDLTNAPVSHATLKFAQSLAHVQHKPIKKLTRAKPAGHPSTQHSTHAPATTTPHTTTHTNAPISRQVSLVKANGSASSVKSPRASIGSSSDMHALTAQLHALQAQLNEERHTSKSINEQMKKLKVENVRMKQNLHSSLRPALNTPNAPPARRVSDNSNSGSTHSTANGAADVENSHVSKKSLLQQQHERSQTLRYPLHPAPINTHTPSIASANTVQQQLTRHNAINARLKAQQKQFQTLPPMSSTGTNRPNTAVLHGNTGKSTGGSPVSSTSRRHHHAESTDSSPKVDQARQTEILSLKQQLIEQCKQFEHQYNTAQAEWSKRVEQLQDLVLTYQDKQDMNAKTVTDLLAQLHQSRLDYTQLNERLQSAEQSNVALTAMNNALTESVKQLQHVATSNGEQTTDALNATKSRWQQKQQKSIHASCIEEIENLKFQLYYGRQITDNLTVDSTINHQRKSTVPVYAPMFVDIVNADDLTAADTPTAETAVQV